MCIVGAVGVARTEVVTGLTVGAAVAGLQDLKASLQSLVGQVDTATAARIRQAEIAIDTTLEKLNALVDRGAARADTLRDKMAGDVFVALAETNKLVQDSTTNAFDNVNNSLANTYKLVSAVPFTGDIPTAVHVVRPYSVAKDSPSASVQIQGYFPDVSQRHPAYVVVGSDERRRPLQVLANNTLEFDLPGRELPAEEQFLRMKFILPVKHLWGLYYSEAEFNAKVYVRRTKPYDVSFSVQTENPAIWSSVTAAREFTASANSDRTSVDASVTAPELFATLVGDNIQYDMSTATFVSWAKRDRQAIVDNVNPCAQGCVASTGSWSWTPGVLSYKLNAPSCPIHWVIPEKWYEVRYQCAGGTHANFANTPTFRVRNRQALAPEVTRQTGTLNLAPAAAAPAIDLPVDWSSVTLVARYRDGSVRRESSARLTSGAAGRPTFHDAHWAIEAGPTQLRVVTR